MHAMILQANFRCSEFILERLEKFREQNLIVSCKILSGKKGSSCENEILKQSGLYCPRVVLPIVPAV